MEAKTKKIIIAISFVIFIFLGLIFYKGARTLSIINPGSSLLSFLTSKDPSQNRLDILILGNRGRGASGGGMLTDSIMVLSYKKDSEDIALISIPRDLFVEVPGFPGKYKINQAYVLGETSPSRNGLQLAKKTVSNVIGVDVDFAIVLDVEALKKFVDILGGITIYETKYKSYRFYQYYTALVPGENILDGEDVLAYVGCRTLCGSDFDRMKNQQKVILAIKDKVVSLNLLARPDKLLEILNTIEEHIQTDIPLAEMRVVSNILSNTDFTNVKQVFFDTSSDGLLYSTHLYGMYVLLPTSGDFSEIQDRCLNVFEPMEEKNTNLEGMEENKIPH